MKMEMEQTMEGKKGPGRPRKEKREGKLCLNVDRMLLREWHVMCVQHDMKLPDALELALKDQLIKNKGKIK